MGWFSNPARDFLDKEADRRIVAAIQAAEKRTSGEIRVHLDKRLKGKDPFDRAGHIFGKLGMHRTEARNGVLIYLALKDHKFALFADEGINQVVPEGYWDETAQKMSDQFKAGKFEEGLVVGIQQIGEQLATFFPYAGEQADINELPDDISYG